MIIITNIIIISKKNKTMENKYNKKQQLIIDKITNTNKNIFVHWKAGVWKSTLLNWIRKTIKDKKMHFLWSTWTAAVNIEGRTVHSFFWLDYELSSQYLNQKKIIQIKTADVIIIDEVSMVRADLFDTINILLQKLIWNKKPFGWKQIVVVWDLLQLEPVVNSKQNKDFYKYYESSFFIASESYYLWDFEYIELDKVYRQDNGVFLDILNNIRLWNVSDEELEVLNKNVIKSKSDFNGKTIYVWMINDTVNKVNLKKLNELEWVDYSFVAEIEWQYDSDVYPAEKELILKEGARIMFLKNTDEFKNGTLGKILKIDISRDEIVIKSDDENIIRLKKETWELKEKLTIKEQQEILELYEHIDNLPHNFSINEEDWTISKIIGTFTQYPLRLWYAITSHKSQWKTFDNIVIDMWNGAFANWQTYVTLSRCRTLEWIQLIKPIKKSDIKANKYVLEFINKQKK